MHGVFTLRMDRGSGVVTAGYQPLIVQVLRWEFYMVCNRLRHAGLHRTAPVKEFNEKNQRSEAGLYIPPGFALMHS